MQVSDAAPMEIQNFILDQGDEFAEMTLGSQWSWTTLNRGLFPTAGAKQSLAFEATVPGSELEYYRVTYNAQKYFPIKGEWTFRIRTELGFGDGYGDTEELPFFRNFRAGGVGSVRGFTTNSLGPKGVVASPGQDVDLDGNEFEPEDDFLYREDTNSLGGNLLTEASMELVFPLPFVEDQRSMRSVLFMDAGNVFDTECLVLTETDGTDSTTHPGCIEGFDVDEIRVGAGVSLTWVTAIGPLTFTFARDLNSKDGDETEGFEFSLGQVF